MRMEEKISQHLLLALIVTAFSGLLGLSALVMGWELWMLPLMMVGCCGVWSLHIARIGSDALLENLCAGLMLGEFFFFSVHESSLHDIPTMACILILVLFMLSGSCMSQQRCTCWPCSTIS